VTFASLALVCLVGIFGPLLAVPERWHVPVVVGELAAGFGLGATGLRVLHASNPTFTFLADMGFALVMFVAGSRVPVRDAQLRSALRTGVLRALLVGLLAAASGEVIATAFGVGHAALYAVLLASSSAALVLPITSSLGLSGLPITQLTAQVAVADTACIVALPLAIDPAHAARAALGAAAVAACAIGMFLVLRYFDRNGMRARLHRLSERRKFALELRINLVGLFALAAVAVASHVSIMLAGFSFGLAVAGIGEPRRLARQLFAFSEGFFAPLFFVWLGASIDLRDLGRHPSFIGLGLVLGLVAVAVHAAMRSTGQPIALGALAAAQLGIPVAAATIGTQTHLLRPGEAAALILAALLTIVIATLGGAAAARRSRAMLTQ
jgi:Kef-type K+ transport system membrane component KefB